MTEREVRRRHPGAEPSMAPRRPHAPGIPGMNLPVESPPASIVPQVGEKKTARRAKRAGVAVLIIGAVGGVVTGVLQAIPSIITASSQAPAAVVDVTPSATQPAMDSANAEIMRLRKCVSLLAQAICQQNGGSLGPEWDCDSDAFRANPTPPPAIRGDKVFPCSAP